VRISYIACAHCGRKIRHGVRRFGPPVVQCGHCGKTMSTGLPDWSALPPGRKIGLALAELLFPSFAAAYGFPVNLLFLFIVVGIWMTVPIMLLMVLLVAVAPGATPDQSLADVLAGTVFMLAVPALLVVLLVRMIRESAAYSRTGTLPVWKVRMAR
jgi:hypothetical protein